MKRLLACACTLALSLGMLAVCAPLAASAASPFAFNGSMSEETLLQYCSRAVTFEGLCGEGGDENMLIKEDIRMLQRTGAKLVSRAALFAWNSTTAEQVQKHYAYAEKTAAMVHEADPEIILEAFVAEIVRKSYVENISIPAWVFEAFGHTPENRNFRFEDIINKEKGPDYWGANAGYPDYSNQETLYWYYYCIRRYIDIGFECIHIQENDEQDLSEIANVDKLLTMCREYAKTKARRGVVLFHSFFSMVNGGAKVGDRLLFDIQGNGLVPNETKKEVVDGETVMKCEISHYEDCWLSWFGRSNGGEHPLGFQVEICPTILEFDNYGGNGKPGAATPSAFYNWGYDDITWFAIQPEWYRNEFLLYLDEFMKTHELTSDGKQMYYPVYPMRRVITAEAASPVTEYEPGKQASMDFLFDYAGSVENIGVEVANDGSIQLKTVGFYRANRQSDGCPNGFNQEDTIRRIFLGDAPEDSRFDTVVLPDGYQPDGTGSPLTTTQRATTRSTASNSPTATRSNAAQPSGETAGTSEMASSAPEAAQSTTGTAASTAANPSGALPADTPGNRKSPLGIVLCCVIGVLLLAGGGAGGWLFYRRKKAGASAGESGSEE